jgi:hypothetical protein
MDPAAGTLCARGIENLESPTTKNEENPHQNPLDDCDGAIAHSGIQLNHH